MMFEKHEFDFRVRIRECWICKDGDIAIELWSYKPLEPRDDLRPRSK